MKVYANAFELEATATLPVTKFFDSLTNKPLHEFDHADRKRIFAVGSTDGFYCGILISAKEQTNFVTLGVENGHPVAHLRNTTDGEPMADVNFFVLKKDSDCGIFSTYKGAGGTRMFGNMLGKLFREYKTQLRDATIAELENQEGEPSKKDVQKIRSAFWAAKLLLYPLMPDSTFSKELERLAKFQTFDYVEPSAPDARFTPVRKQISKQRRAYTFRQDDGAAAKIRKFITKFVSEAHIAEGSVRGFRANGEFDTVPIDPDIYCLAKYKHDEVVNQDNIRLDSLHTVPMVKKLFGLVRARSELFAKASN